MFESTLFKSTRAAVDAVRPNGGIVVLTHDQAVGKSMSARLLKSQLPDSTRSVSAFPGMTAAAAMLEVAAAFGEHATSMRDANRLVTKAVVTENTVLVVDNVHLAAGPLCDLSRYLVETEGNRCTILLLGKGTCAPVKSLVASRPDLVKQVVRARPLGGDDLLRELRRWRPIFHNADDSVLLHMDELCGHGLLSAWDAIGRVAEELLPLSGEPGITVKLAKAIIEAMRRRR